MAADAGPSRRRIALARQSREKSGRLASARAAWPTFFSAGKIFRRDRTFATRGRIETGITGGSQPAWLGLLSRGAIRPRNRVVPLSVASKRGETFHWTNCVGRHGPDESRKCVNDRWQ